MKHLLASVTCAIAFASAGLAQDAPAGFARAAERALADFPSAGVAVVRIEGGEIAWRGFSGQQAPGVPAQADTLFNTASIAKTVTAELVLRLAAAGELSLDEKIWAEYRHPDLAEDPRYDLLTPEILLSHQAGLKNWPYEYADGRLAFIQDPGTGLTYSGAGYEMLAEFVARRMQTPFPQLVAEWIVRPVGIEGDLFLGAVDAPPARRAMPMRRDGTFADIGDAEMPPSAADNLFVTAPAYARLLIAMMQGTASGDGDPRVRSVLDTSAHAPCTMADRAQCPVEAGQSLGWSIARFADAHHVFHSGSDWGENAIVVYDVVRQDGWVIFVNGGNGMGVWLRLMESLAPDNAYFRFVHALPQVRARLDAVARP